MMELSLSALMVSIVLTFYISSHIVKFTKYTFDLWVDEHKNTEENYNIRPEPKNKTVHGFNKDYDNFFSEKKKFCEDMNIWVNKINLKNDKEIEG